MVRVYGAVFGDVTDRAERSIGTISATDEEDGNAEPLRLSRPQGVLVTPLPWWAHYPWGRVLCLDDFEGTLKWAQGGGTVTKASDPTHVHDGASSMKMVTGAVAGNDAIADLFTLPAAEDSDYVAIEFWWSLSTAAAGTPRDFYLTWSLEDRSMNVAPQFGIRYQNYQATVAKERLQVWNSAGAWEDIAGGGYKTMIVYPAFNYWLLVLKRDLMAAWKYEYFQMNDSGFSLSGRSGEAGGFLRPAQWITLVATTDVALATTAYVDDFVLTDKVQLHL